MHAIDMQLAHRPLTCSFCKIKTSWYAILQHVQVSDGVFQLYYSIVAFASPDKGMSEAIIVRTLEHHKWLKWRSLSLSLPLSPSPSSLAYQGGRTSIEITFLGAVGAV